MKLNLSLSLATIALAAMAGSVSADTIKISGASTVFNVVVQGAKPAVEKSTGHTLQVLSSATGKGLADLIDGAVDIAMVSEPIDIAVEAVAATGKKLDTKAVKVFELKKDEIVFVVHPSNAVSKLSWEQIGAIHTGKISNWKEVGGADKAIVLYADSVTGGTRAMIHQVLMAKADWAAGTKS
jgi:phosphate transport system substrate-binding protein